MPELRQNIVTRDWVVIATERAKRPDAFAVRRDKEIAPVQREAGCPFCPGNEKETGTEVFHFGDSTRWDLRVIANRYPALVREGMPMRRVNGVHRSMNAIGYHEVVIEHPRHDMHPPLMTNDELTNVLKAYRRRYSEVKADSRVEAVVIFRNHGPGAGTSQPHPHSQIVATPVVPALTRLRLEIATRHFDETGECVFCRTLRDERSTGERIIHGNRHFTAFVPYAALTPFHIWVFPLRHMSAFDMCTDDELTDLASMLRTVLRKLSTGLNNPDYNLVIRSLPTHLVHTDYFHWYVTIIPRISIAAGFELGSGMFINPSIPEESAAFLREVSLPAE